ncbi:hypothetical protein BKN38_09855 [Helicobacter sp. CLO-3]|uniref:hypothetical protein n=1 Tax=unclassified Helicobacter TaxID=2593540 RepID=UPI000805641E|nr:MULTISPECIES: hypothetical protein [unclassified Helicobacter]OBV28586.1 hypothetical protein BA723_08770 [Helicobacter sp. CLO-3]OHU81033.1 hypothetical protein BKN38_09855 [Helicobacter sp. CLO-3]
MTKAIIVAVVICAVVAVVFIVKAMRQKALLGLEPIKQESLSMREVVEFFKEPETLKSLQENKDLLAVVIREKKDDGKIQIVLTAFNESTNEMASFPHTKSFLVEKIDEDLSASFGDKDMIVLQ